jgi:preprotein translocase SecE subunit
MAKDVTGTKQKKKGNRFTNWIKSIFIELKKVTWPTFSNTVKQTLVVLGVTVAFLLVLIGIDTLLGLGHSWFINNL